MISRLATQGVRSRVFGLWGLAIFFTCNLLAKDPIVNNPDYSKLQKELKLKDGIYAVMETSQGQILLELYAKKTPLTVTNFVGLVEGKLSTSTKKGLPFYNGLTFHRVIPNFMVQGGDPEGTGRGGPGYKFPDEFDDSLKHDRAGILSMANSGPGTNGSQFFITHKETSWLDDRHTIFGAVVKGLDVVNQIVKGDKIKTVTILRLGKEAMAFQGDQKSFDQQKNDIVGREKQKDLSAIKDQKALIKKKWPKAVTTASGLMFVATTAGVGPKPKKGSKIKAHYTGTLLDGKKFDSSRDRGRAFEFNVGMGRVIVGWDEAFLDMNKGEKRVLIIPHHLAYGERGYPPVIPPKATLVFDVELIDF